MIHDSRGDSEAWLYSNGSADTEHIRVSIEVREMQCLEPSGYDADLRAVR